MPPSTPSSATMSSPAATAPAATPSNSCAAGSLPGSGAACPVTQGRATICPAKRSIHMDWQSYIHPDSDVLRGKPVVKGTRLAVDFILSLLAAGWTEQQVLDNYPTLSPDALRAVFAF